MRARREILSAGAASGGASAREGAGGGLGLERRLGLLVGRVLELVEVDALLGELGLDHVRGLGDLRVVLGARLLGERVGALSRLLGRPPGPLGLSLCAGLRHGSPR